MYNKNMNTYSSKLKQDAIAFINEHKLGVIATVNAERKPECATVHYFFDEENWVIYIVTRSGSRKYQNILQNPNVAFVIGTAMGHQTLQIEGTAHVNTDAETNEFIKRPNVLNLVEYMVGNEHDPFFDSTGSDYKIFHIRVSWARIMFFDNATKKEFFEQIIP